MTLIDRITAHLEVQGRMAPADDPGRQAALDMDKDRLSRHEGPSLLREALAEIERLRKFEATPEPPKSEQADEEANARLIAAALRAQAAELTRLAGEIEGEAVAMEAKNRPDLGTCKRCALATAVRDYNGHGYFVCLPCCDTLNDEFDEDYA